MSQLQAFPSLRYSQIIYIYILAHFCMPKTNRNEVSGWLKVLKGLVHRLHLSSLLYFNDKVVCCLIIEVSFDSMWDCLSWFILICCSQISGSHLFCVSFPNILVLWAQLLLITPSEYSDASFIWQSINEKQQESQCYTLKRQTVRQGMGDCLNKSVFSFATIFYKFHMWDPYRPLIRTLPLLSLPHPGDVSPSFTFLSLHCLKEHVFFLNRTLSLLPVSSLPS